MIPRNPSWRSGEENAICNPAETYESYMVPARFGRWAPRPVDSARPRPQDRVLDLACGTGVVARQVASRVGSAKGIVGVELNRRMREVARAAAAREGLAIEFREGRAEKLPLPDSSFEVVLCQFALMFMDDRAEALREMQRVLGGAGGSASRSGRGSSAIRSTRCSTT